MLRSLDDLDWEWGFGGGLVWVGIVFLNIDIIDVKDEG